MNKRGRGRPRKVLDCQLYKDAIHTEMAIDLYRCEIGLPAIRRGERKCLRCSKLFRSGDLKREKMCERCREVYSEDKWNSDY